MTTLALVGPYRPKATIVSRPASSDEAGWLARELARAIHEFKAAWSPRAFAFDELSTLGVDADRLTDISPATLVLAERFLTTWPLNLPTPEVGIDPDGEVSFDWFGADGSNFSVSIRHDARLAYAGAFAGAKTKHGTDRFDDEIPSEVVEAVRDLRREMQITPV
jgi:hypothetical protein